MSIEKRLLISTIRQIVKKKAGFAPIEIRIAFRRPENRISVRAISSEKDVFEIDEPLNDNTYANLVLERMNDAQYAVLQIDCSEKKLNCSTSNDLNIWQKIELI